jgi:hypothetical protein
VIGSMLSAAADLQMDRAVQAQSQGCLRMFVPGEMLRKGARPGKEGPSFTATPFSVTRFGLQKGSARLPHRSVRFVTSNNGASL